MPLATETAASEHMSTAAQETLADKADNAACDARIGSTVHPPSTEGENSGPHHLSTAHRR